MSGLPAGGMGPRRAKPKADWQLMTIPVSQTVFLTRRSIQKFILSIHQGFGTKLTVPLWSVPRKNPSPALLFSNSTPWNDTLWPEAGSVTVPLNNPLDDVRLSFKGLAPLGTTTLLSSPQVTEFVIGAASPPPLKITFEFPNAWNDIGGAL